MSTLRRRIFGVSSDTPPSSGTSTPSGDKNEDLAVVPSKHLEKLAEKARRPKGTKRRNAWIFGLGGVFGIVVAAFFAGNQEMLHLNALTDLNLDSILDVLPAGLIQDAKDLQVCLHRKQCSMLQKAERVGEELMEDTVITETRTRCCRIRFLLGRSTRKVRGRRGRTSRHHDTRRHIDWLGKLGHGRAVQTMVSKAAMG